MLSAGQRACLCWATSPRRRLLPSRHVMMVATGTYSGPRPPRPWPVTFRKGRQHLRHMLLLGALYAAGLSGHHGHFCPGGRWCFAQVSHHGTPVTAQMASDPSFQKAMWTATVLSLPLSLLFRHAGPGAARRATRESPVLQPDGLRAQRGACPAFLFTWLGIGAPGALVISITACRWAWGVKAWQLADGRCHDDGHDDPELRGIHLPGLL